jgi:hypothetical protein
MSYLRTDTEYRDYWQAIANAHVSIDTFCFGEDERLQKEEANALLTGWILWADEPQPATIGGINDGFVAQQVAPVAIIKAMEKEATAHADQDVVFESAKELATDILSRLYRDKANRAAQLVMAEIVNTRMGKFDTIINSTRFVGYLLEIPLRHPVNLSYDVSKWNF